jgi:Ribbon-helix-helix protein, copG family.
MKAVKVDDEAYKILEELATKSNTSIKELVTKAVKLLYIGKEQENIAKTIVDMYQNS